MSTTLYPKSVDPVITDSRAIDPQLSELSGEAGKQVAGVIDQHLQKTAQPWEQIPEPVESDPTYYDRPVLKAPVWGWEVSALLLHRRTLGRFCCFRRGGAVLSIRRT